MQGADDGGGLTFAKFNGPSGITIDQSNNLYVSDSGNNSIRKITSTGNVTTLTAAALPNPVFVNDPRGITIDAQGTLYICEAGSNVVSKIVNENSKTVIAGSGSAGYFNATGTTASFNKPSGIVISGGDFYVTDSGNNAVRRITSAGVVTTFVGGTSGNTIGDSDGDATTARFNNPTGILRDGVGNLLITDTNNHKIRLISPAGIVTTVLGNDEGDSTGSFSATQFNNPRAIANDINNSFYIVDSGNHKIKMISALGYSITPALPAGLVLNEDGSISGTPIASSPATDYTISARNLGGGSSKTISIAVQSTLPTTAPTATAQTFCAKATVADLVATGTNLKWYDVATEGTALSTSTVLATGTYYVSQTVDGVESGRTLVSVSFESTTWNGSAWSNGLPTSTKGVIISGNLLVEDNITACSLTVNNGAIVVVKSGVNLEIANQVDVAVGSSLTFENNANLIQINDVANTGNATVKRDSNPLYRLDYTLWSAPVTNANSYLAPFSPLTSNAGTSIRFYTYDAATNLYTSVLSAASTPFALGKGYLIRMPNEDPAVRGVNSPYFKGTTPIVFNGQFTGVLNNGTINLSGLTPSSYNSIGNPYPSAIDADTFINSNAGTGTLYFWRNKNSDNGSSYATYTLAGAVSNGGYTPNGSIAVGQGFITKAPSSGTITFTNAMRASTETKPATFLRTAAKTKAKKDKIWLNLSMENSQVNQILLAYMDGATTGIDADIDGKYINDSANALTWDINNEEYVIQGRPLFTDTDVVPLNFKTDVAGDYTIAKDKVEGVFATGQGVYLVDTVTGTQTNLQTNAYTFTTAVGTFNSRFNLVYRTDNSLGVNELIQDQNSIVVYKQNAVLHIDAGSTIIKNVKVFDLGGRLLLEQKAVNATKTIIENLAVANQVLMIQITTDDNRMITKKVIF